MKFLARQSITFPALSLIDTTTWPLFSPSIKFTEGSVITLIFVNPLYFLISKTTGLLNIPGLIVAQGFKVVFCPVVSLFSISVLFPNNLGLVNELFFSREEPENGYDARIVTGWFLKIFTILVGK